MALAEALATRIREMGGRIELNAAVSTIGKADGQWAVTTVQGKVHASGRVIVTTALPLVADMIAAWAPKPYVAALNGIQYIGNVCLVLELDRPCPRPTG
ncbi:MAG: FAD-dependent oxidoreductase [Aquabacterium sp.]